jgi:hypothetical protein
MSDNTKLIESPPLYEDICKNNENGDRNDIIDINSINICNLMYTICCNKITYCFQILNSYCNSIHCSCCEPCLDKFNNCCCKCCSCCNECNPPDI